MTIAQDFKDDPLEFMKENIVLVRCGFSDSLKNHFKKQLDSSVIGNIKYFTLKPQRNSNSRGFLGDMRVPIYLLQNAGFNVQDDHKIRAYWCPYSDNDTLGVMLGDRAPFMFTAEMSGCNLGLGSLNPDGSRLVYHSNVRNTTNQEQSQDTALASVGSSTTVLRPSVYKNTGLASGVLQITPFGIREQGQWNLYYQIHSYQSDTRIELAGVNPVTGVSAF